MPKRISKEALDTFRKEGLGFREGYKADVHTEGAFNRLKILVARIDQGYQKFPDLWKTGGFERGLAQMLQELRTPEQGAGPVIWERFRCVACGERVNGLLLCDSPRCRNRWKSYTDGWQRTILMHYGRRLPVMRKSAAGSS